MPPFHPTGPQPEQKGSKRQPVIIGSAVVIALVLIVGAFLVSTRGSGDLATSGNAPTATKAESTTRRESTTEPEPTTRQAPATRHAPTTDPPSSPQAGGIEREVEEISAFVEKARGLKFKEPVKVEVEAEDGFNRRLLAKFDEDAAKMDKSGLELQALGIIPDGTDYVATLRTLLGIGVVGYYDPENGELVVKGAEITPMVRTVMAHELTHALDDQAFELNRPALDELGDDRGFGWQALVEGDARYVEDKYRASLSSADQREADSEESRIGIDHMSELSDVPLSMAQLIMEPYEIGLSFLDHEYDAGGVDHVNSIFTNVPSTSTQVIHPEKYDRGVAAKEVPTPPADGKVIDDGVMGELMTRYLLSSGLAESQARTAAAGWAGDHYVAWTDTRGRACVRIDWVMDSARDLNDLREGLDHLAASQRGSATVDDAGEGSVRYTACQP